jgi:hypothetical protein
MRQELLLAARDALAVVALVAVILGLFVAFGPG